METPSRSSEHRGLATAALRYGLPNVIIVAGIAAAANGGWPVYVVLAAIYLIGGPIDDAVDDASGVPHPAARWFCDGNLLMTLPLLLLLTFFVLYDLDADRLPRNAWDRQLGLAAATCLIGSCYAMFGATAAHELTHRSQRVTQWSAHGLLALMFNSSFTVFHVHGHHRWVGTDRDPATARRGEHIFAFVPRTVIGQFGHALRHEAARLRSAGRSRWSLRNSVINGLALSLAYVAGAAALSGWRGVAVFLAAAGIGRLLHEFVNYLQHYGLVRIEGDPIAARHTWDCNRTFSNAMQYNLPRHSDHHLFASKPCWRLSASPQAPALPRGYLTMVLIALVPPLWRRVMDPLLADWDEQLASGAERAELQQRVSGTSG